MDRINISAAEEVSEFGGEATLVAGASAGASSGAGGSPSWTTR